MADDMNVKINVEVVSDREAVDRLQKQAEEDAKKVSEPLATEYKKAAQKVARSAERVSKEFIEKVPERKRIAEIRDELKKLALVANELGDDSPVVAQGLSRINAELVALGASSADIGKLAADFDRFQRAAVDNKRFAITEFKKELQELQVALDRADRANTQARRRVDIIGDVDTSVQTFAMTQSAFGIGGAGATGAVGDVFASVEALVQLKAASKNMIPALKSVVIELGGWRNILVRGGLLGAIGAFTFALTELRKNSDKLESSMLEITEARLQAERDIAALTTTELEDKRRVLQAQQDVIKAQYDVEKARLDSATELIDEAGIGTQLAAFIFDKAGITEYNSALEAQKTTVNDLKTEIDKNAVTLKVYTDAVNSNTFSVQQAIEAEKRLIKIREQAFSDIFSGDIDLSGLSQQITANLNELGKDIDLYRLFTAFGLNTENIADRLNLLNEENTLLAYLRRLQEGQSKARIQAETGLSDAQYEAVAQIHNRLKAEQFLQSVIDATNDAVERATKIQEAQARFLEAQNALRTEEFNQQATAIQRAMDVERERKQLLETITGTTIQDRIAAIEEETRLLESYRKELALLSLVSPEARDALAELESQLSELASEADFLTSDEAILTAANNVLKSYFDDIKKIHDDYNNKIADINRKLDNTLKQAAERLKDALEKAYQDRTDKLADAEATAAIDREKAARERLSALIKLEEEIAAQRKAIVDKSKFELANAIARRDALAAYLALQERDRELEQLEEREKQKRDAINAAYEKQLRDIQIRLDAQRAKINQAYEQQVRDAYQAYTRTVETARQEAQASIEIERQKANQLLQTRQSAALQELAILSNLASQGTNIMNIFVSNTLSALTRLVTNSPMVGLGNFGGTQSINNMGYNFAFTLQNQQAVSQQGVAEMVGREVYDIIRSVNLGRG